MANFSFFLLVLAICRGLLPLCIVFSPLTTATNGQDAVVIDLLLFMAIARRGFRDERKEVKERE